MIKEDLQMAGGLALSHVFGFVVFTIGSVWVFPELMASLIGDPEAATMFQEAFGNYIILALAVAFAASFVGLNVWSVYCGRKAVRKIQQEGWRR